MEWVASPFSRRSSQPRDQNCVSPALAGRFFTAESGEAQFVLYGENIICFLENDKMNLPDVQIGCFQGHWSAGPGT